MPGRRLSNDERRLLEFWQAPPANFPKSLLRQIRIQGGPGLRGIRRIVVPIPYPLTAICGRNGVGKSTLLALAAISARSPEGWRVYWGNTRPRTRPDARVEYSFADFFHRRPGDPPLEGLRLEWVLMDRGNEVELVEERRGNRWVRIADPGRHVGPRRPSREIDYIPMSRVLPAGEFGIMRSAFGRLAIPDAERLTPDSIAKLSFIMGRAYEEVETRYVRGLGLPTCRAGFSYSGFDMGGGETSVIALLSRLQAMPIGGLLLIEEVELGLHVEAQIRLVQVLLEFCRVRRIQIICTTHSEVILDHLPRQARVLLRHNGDEHEAVDNISTRFALYEMGGEAQPELVIYTEDKFAAVIVSEALAGPLRSRVEIRDVGSNVTLARQAVAHLRLNGQLMALSAFDGDCGDEEIADWIRDERAERHDLAPLWLVLPGDALPPERWVIRELQQREYVQELARQLNCETAAATAHVEAMRVQLDHHDSGYTLSLRTGLDPAEARLLLIRSVARQHPALETLRARVGELLGHAIGQPH